MSVSSLVVKSINKVTWTHSKWAFASIRMEQNISVLIIDLFGFIEAKPAYQLQANSFSSTSNQLKPLYCYNNQRKIVYSFHSTIFCNNNNNNNGYAWHRCQRLNKWMNKFLPTARRRETKNRKSNITLSLALSFIQQFCVNSSMQILSIRFDVFSSSHFAFNWFFHALERVQDAECMHVFVWRLIVLPSAQHFPKRQREKEQQQRKRKRGENYKHYIMIGIGGFKKANIYFRSQNFSIQMASRRIPITLRLW